MTPAELEAHYVVTASIDPSFAAQERAFYESRTAVQLSGLKAGAWAANDAYGYQMARSYLERTS